MLDPHKDRHGRKLTKNEILFLGKVRTELMLRGMNYQDLAEAIGSTYSSVKQFMSGWSHSKTTAKKIADYLELFTQQEEV